MDVTHRLTALLGDKSTVDPRTLWPADFRHMVEACELAPNDRVGFGVLADWLDERDEPDLAAGFRLLFANPAWELTAPGPHVGAQRYWCATASFPETLRFVKSYAGLPGFALELFRLREKVRKELGL